MSFERSYWHKWPMLASILAMLFIAFGISLLSRVRTIQSNITREVALLDELNKINEALNQLSIAHHHDLSVREYGWHDEMNALRERITLTEAKYADRPGMAQFRPDIEQILHHTDSLHRNSMEATSRGSDVGNSEAVLGLMIKRGQKVIERTARSIHEEGLAVHSAMLSERWKEAKFLLITACLLAVILAWLVGKSDRLLIRSRQDTSQLAKAKADLERTNQDLRETMLSKEEKEMMIKEIHHRVKNNLQIVKSLIRFQMDQVKDPHMMELFNECVNRVSAMALVHEQTYLSKDLANIDVNTYLSHLTRDLCQAYTIDQRLELDIRINVPTLGVDTLIPLGLLINEIISNSLKYAFAGRSQGTIFVHLNGDDHNGLHLRIGDDGVGLPDRARWMRPQSLGMELIHTLSDQLDAMIELEPGPGTVYTLSGQVQEKRRRA